MQRSEEKEPELPADDVADWTICIHFYQASSGNRKVNGRDVYFEKGKYIGGLGRSVRRMTLTEVKKMADEWMEHQYEAMKQIRVVGEDSKPAYEVDNFNKFK